MKRCINCIWLDNNNYCIKFGKKIIFPRKPTICPYYNIVPRVVDSYIKGVSKATGLSKKSIIKSRPFKNYLRDFTDTRTIEVRE